MRMRLCRALYGMLAVPTVAYAHRLRVRPAESLMSPRLQNVKLLCVGPSADALAARAQTEADVKSGKVGPAPT